MRLLLSSARTFGALIVGVVCPYLLLVPSFALAQSLELLSPISVVNVREGRDFATHELSDPWDFQERRDIGWEELYSGGSIAAEGGVWRGSYESQGAYVFPLFGGFKSALHAEGPSGDRNLPKLGIRHPIDANRYYWLSYRLKQSQRSTHAVYWKNDGSFDYWPDGSQFAASVDGFYDAQLIANSSWHIYSHNLKNPAFEVVRGGWNGNVLSLRLDPSTVAPAGARTEFDWIRLVDPNSAPDLEIRWAERNLPQGTIITVWHDNNNQGFDGSVLGRYRVGSGPSPTSRYVSFPALDRSIGSHVFPTAALPPGNHYFYVTAHRINGSTLSQIAQSSYSAALRINGSPSVDFLSPTTTSGADYASEILGNPWDMTSLDDVKNRPSTGLPQELRQWSQASTPGGVFQAVADPPWTSLGNTQSDPQVWLNIPDSQPVDAYRFRYLTYRLAIDETLFPTIADKVRDGVVTRGVVWSDALFGDGGSTKAHILYEGFHTYTIDLWDTDTVERGLPWGSTRWMKNLRIDPIEPFTPVWFFLDWATLTAENTPQNNRYEISWSIDDRENDPVQVSVFIDTDDNGFNGFPIAELPPTSSPNGSFVWNTQGVSDGVYYPYIEVSDGKNSYQRYAPAPLVLGGATTALSLAKRTPYDYDGNGKSDPVVYRQGAGGVFFLQSQQASPPLQWGGPQFTPVEGDFDGDKKSDFSVVKTDTGAIEWFIRRSNNDSVFYSPWGVLGDQLAAADYDGDGRDELGVYRKGLWFLWSLSGAVSVQAWGVNGDIPVPGDYDGDGAADIAVWRPADGTWWIINSGYGNGFTDTPLLTAQWGLPGDIPLTADYDGDKKTDLVVYRPSLGMWFIRKSSDSSVESYQWGLPGDIPVVGDYLGDSRADLAVWRPSNGTWYLNDRSGGVQFTQWGLPGDTIPKP